MAKIALVSIMWKDRFIEEVGIQIIAAVLKKNTGHEIEIFYKFPKENYEDFYKRLITYKPSIVGFSLSHKYTGLEPLYAGVKELKEELGDVNIFIGGVFASTNAENILEKIPQVDCVFIGESENNIVEYIECITRNKNIDHIDGIVFRNTMQITRNPKKNYIFDLDSLPFADRTFMETDEYKQTVFKRANIAGSRGCHGKCHFCNVPSMYNAYDVPWRGRSVKNIVDELQFLNTRYGTFIFSFVDSSFEDNIPLADGKKRLAELANEIISRNLTIFYSCCFRAETFKDNAEDHELISLLVKSGLYNLLIGVEAGNKRALNEFAKKATVENNYEAIDVFSQYPVYISKGFIMFTPQSTPDSLLKNLEFAHSVRLDEELIYLTTKAAVFDGTPFVKDLQKLGLLKDDYDWENEYPYDWENDNVKAFANAMQFIRDVYMLELEYTQYYGRNMIILQRLATEECFDIFEYQKYHIKRLRTAIGKYNYDFISKCIDLCSRGWNEHEYRIIKEHNFDNGFLKVYQDMVLQSKKFSRLLKSRGISLKDLVESGLKGR